MHDFLIMHFFLQRIKSALTQSRCAFSSFSPFFRFLFGIVIRFQPHDFVRLIRFFQISDIFSGK